MIMCLTLYKATRKLPLGNFVSFPAEIARTGTNIVRRALREINEEIRLLMVQVSFNNC